MTNHEGHIKLWNELAVTGAKSKIIAFHRVFGKDVPVPAEHCFACQENDSKRDDDRCNSCPLTDENTASCLDGLFDAWCDATDPEERKRLAAIIRDLEWKERT